MHGLVALCHRGGQHSVRAGRRGERGCGRERNGSEAKQGRFRPRDFGRGDKFVHRCLTVITTTRPATMRPRAQVKTLALGRLRPKL